MYMFFIDDNALLEGVAAVILKTYARNEALCVGVHP
jgi:hypothetical protein